MGLDLYIEARVIEEKTGRVISTDGNEEYTDDEDKGYFEICWWCSWVFSDIREKMIEISNKYAKNNYTDSEFVIPIPQEALREIYAYIVNRSYLSDDEHFEVLSGDTEWQIKSSYEKMNLINAEKLHDFIWTLESIKYDNGICIDEKYIADKNDLMHLKENPRAYKWEFRIYNSY